jgi:hypothetical protein
MSLNIDGGNNTGWNFGPLNQIYRLSNVGVLQTSVAELDEITQATISMSEPDLFATEFDETAAIPGAMRHVDPGTVQVASEFDEITVVLP